MPKGEGLPLLIGENKEYCGKGVVRMVVVMVAVGNGCGAGRLRRKKFKKPHGMLHPLLLKKN